MVKLLEYLDNWITRQSGTAQMLHHRIGISPIFTKVQLHGIASTTVKLESHPATVSGQHCWLGGLATKADNVRFCNYMCAGAVGEPPEFAQIRENLLTLSLIRFLEAEGIHRYSTYS